MSEQVATFEQLEDLSRRFHALMANPHPGLSTWSEMTIQRGIELRDALLSVLPVEETQ